MLCIRRLFGSRHEEPPPMGETPDLIGSVGAFGRETDRENIVNLLFRDNARVVIIHGVGGSGKSTLAKLVYDAVDDQFDEKIWIFVSDTFEFRKVIKKILGRQGVSGKENDGELEAKLRDRLRGKRFLLVLDDLWSNNRDKFTNLARFLLGSSDGCKIIVTTREQSVVNMIDPNTMGIVSTYPLNILSDDDLLLFLGDMPDNLIEIGTQIVGKCEGLPLPVKILARLLLANKEVSYWESIRDGNHIQLLLRLSRDLPVYCKDSFFYFSPLLEDERMECVDLIDIWMVHGLFESLDPEMSAAAVEKEIRSVIEMQDGNRAVLCDLIREFTKNQNECLVINGSTGEVGTNARHLSIGCPKFGDDPSFLHKLKLNDLQTLILRAATRKFVEKLFSRRFLSKCKLLQMVNLKESFLKSPKCIYSIKCLKCLNLSRNNRIEKLPSYIFDMASLEILRLDGCEKLKILPKSIKKLSGLKVLTLTTTATKLPDGIECLTSLRSLLIRKCTTLTSLPISSYLSCLTALQSLAIYSCTKLVFNEENVGCYSNLSLRELRLENLPKMEALPLPLPVRPTLPDINLRHLQIKHCRELKKLPGSLVQMDLDHIEMMDCPRLESVPENLSQLSSLKFFSSISCGGLPDKYFDRRQHIIRDY